MPNQTLLSIVYAGFLFSGSISQTNADALLRQPTVPIACSAGLLVKDELYFGLSKREGGTISEFAWQQFVNRVVTPRFQAGLTVVNAQGQYLNRSGKLVREPSKLLLLTYEQQVNKERAIAEIITLYKQTFHQESVLRVTTCARVTF